MPTPVNIQRELDRHREANTLRMAELVAEQYNTELTRGFALVFTTQTESDAVGLGRLLFAKGLRLLLPTPAVQPGGQWQLRVGAKRSLREITTDDFLCDLITIASGVHGCFESWQLLADDAAEQSQPHIVPAASEGESR